MELAVGPPLSWETRSMKLLPSLFLMLHRSSETSDDNTQDSHRLPYQALSWVITKWWWSTIVVSRWVYFALQISFMHISCSYYINHSWFKAYASLLCEWHSKVRCSEDENDFLSISGNCSLRLPKLGQELYSCEVMWISSKQFKIQCVYYQVDEKVIDERRESDGM